MQTYKLHQSYHYITKVAGNKDLLDKLKSADVKQAKELLDKAGVKVDEADVKKVKEAKFDF